MTITVQTRVEGEPTAECQSCLGFRITWAADNAEELTPLVDSERMLAEAHHEEIAALREQAHSDQARVIQAEVAANEAEAERDALRAALRKTIRWVEDCHQPDGAADCEECANVAEARRVLKEADPC